MTEREVELLAPAGTWESLRAAVANGADAVYFGVQRYNARMRAGNFRQEETAGVMHFLHEHGARGYVTLNILIFPGEMEEVVRCLDELNAVGVDGVIVQDMGLAALVAEQKRAGRWSMQLHVSTQMTVSSPGAVRLVDEWFAPEQIVLARELNLREIAACAAATDARIEAFCHGALCVAYSGQCFTSESFGQRSANRGECAQACRLPYSLEVDGRLKDLGERRYLFSPQDLCAVGMIPELLRAGVRSFKIEGRQKAPEYVAAAVRAYRCALDAALRGEEPHPAAHDLYAMQMTFSRGFSTGWLEGTDHPRLTHGRFSKKRGVLLGRVERVTRGCIALEQEPTVRLLPGDGFVVDTGAEEWGGSIVRARGRFLYFYEGTSGVSGESVKPGCPVWKTSDPTLQKELRATWAQVRMPMEPAHSLLHLRVSGRAGEELVLCGGGKTVRSRMPLVAATKHPLDEQRARRQLGRLGGTGYALGSLRFDVEGECLLPLSELNRMRRELVELLDAEGVTPREPFDLPPVTFEQPPAAPDYELSVLCRTAEQAEIAAAAGVDKLYLDLPNLRELPAVARRLRAEYPGLPLWAATLRILKPGEEGFFKYLHAMEPDGVLVRNLGAALYWRERGVPMVGDFSLNTANPYSLNLWLRFGLDACTVSYDLDAWQVGELLEQGGAAFWELVLHRHTPLFHSEHCVFCTFLSDGHSFKDCGQPCEHHSVRVIDRTGATHILRSDEACRNTLFNARAESSVHDVRAALRTGLRRLRIECLDETARQVRELLAAMSFRSPNTH